MAQGVVIAVWPILALAVIVLVTGMTGATFGDFITAQAAASAATGAVAAAALAANASLVARETIRKAKPVLDSSPEGSVDGAQPGLISGGIEGRDIVFRYAPELPPVLDRVNISVAPGEHVAIVGPSGCGKTTLMRILLGLEDPESGVIAVDGRDLASLNRPAVRRQIGSVLQSSMLLPGELRNNIDMGRGLTTTQVWEALDAASLGDDVRAMPMGLNTPVTDGGGTLSGGQQQRVLIARAMAGNPRILVLDEATSALDNITQATVVETLNSLRITRIVVAHRLSTIRHADRIIVLDAGRVVDDGTYDELMAKPGAFRELALRQQT
jgi:ABC-type bacteriocin/lantibiotic exporter with double-glycine peptidase domain